jgi:outer membrane protein assembly factor BamB
MNTLRFLIALGVILCLVLSPVIALMPENTAQAQPADSPWPMFRQNPQHTGRSPYSCAAFGVPKLKWSFIAGWPVYPVHSSPAIGADGTIYVGSWDGKLYAINSDGSQSWNFTTGYTIDSSPAIGADGTIYVGSHDKLYAINPDGSHSWNFTKGWPLYSVLSSPAIGANGTIYVGSYVGLDHSLYAINPDGSESWNFTTGYAIFPVWSSPAIGANGTIYVGSNSKLYAINPDGSQSWNFTTGSWVASSPAIGANGTIYVGSDDSKLYAINPDGSHSWNFTTGGWVRSSPAIGANGTIYVGSGDGKLYAINPDGSHSWDFNAGWPVYPVDSSPAIGADGTIYVGSDDGNLYAINPDGSPSWNFTIGSVVRSSPAIGADGTIYVGSGDGKLYAIAGLYFLTIAPPAAGSVIAPGEGIFAYDWGTVVELVAEAEEGYCFVEWTGDVGTIADVNAAETTITMEGNYEIAARFEQCPAPGVCFIATAAYGTPMAEEIEILREFRDKYLLTNPLGQALTDLYYRVSPPMAEFVAEHPTLKPIVRAGLLPAVAMSTIAVHTTWAEKMAIVGSLVLTSVAVTVWATRRRRRGSQYT